LYRETKFRNGRLICAKFLNTTVVASGYAGRDPQGGKAIESFWYSF